MKNKIIILFFIISFFNLLYSKDLEKHDNYEEMIELAQNINQAFEIIKDEKVSRGVLLNDETGMLGGEFTGITTTLGSLEAKRTTLNPNFSSVIYNYIKELNLSSGDNIAVNLSSSFPSLNIQVIMTLEQMGYEPVIISSIGASTFGATDPEFTYIDMEYELYQNDIIHHKSQLVSPGGDDDLGLNMDSLLLKSIFERLKRYGYRIYIEPKYENNLNERLLIYKNCKALINVGGNYISFTGNDIGYESSYGIIRSRYSYNYDERGLTGAFLTQKKDVIHLLNIKGIALENNLPIGPKGEIEIGSNGCFYEVKYNKIWFSLTLLLWILLVMREVYEKKRNVKKNIKAIVKQEFMD